MQSKIKDKQQSLRDLLRCTNEGERWRLREKYKNARREAKKAVTEAKNTAYRRMYACLETKEGEHDMFKIAKAKERRIEDLGLTYQQETDNPAVHRKQRNNSYCRGITQGELRIALRKMLRAKVVGLDNIPIEAWKCLGDDGVQWLTTLFNLIFKNGKMPDQWRSSVVVPLYKNKGDTQCCGNYRGIKLSKASVHAPVGDTNFFPVEMGLHQGSALSPFLFMVVMDELSKLIQELVPWCMLFSDDIVLVAETKQSLNERLEEWRVALEDKCLRISRSKTKYLFCDFSGVGDSEDTQITNEDQSTTSTSITAPWVAILVI
ncbi:uncharacterized protein LOC143556356 [Bidens hawaiensis]|uniref:uncharacterized protein LOC143556356 n=1 Tax=Bidens hawaiensis TaxID=980011 RepID=UPI00404AF2EE